MCSELIPCPAGDNHDPSIGEELRDLSQREHPQLQGEAAVPCLG